MAKKSKKTRKGYKAGTVCHGPTKVLKRRCKRVKICRNLKTGVFARKSSCR